MIHERWPQIDKLFQIAVEIDPTGRAAFLDKECSGDHVLRKEVESLMSADSFNWDFIETPAVESAAVFFADDEDRLTAGERVCHYEIVELIGKGGMGEVYLAKDQILNRNVALKLLPSDYTQDKNRVDRFQREAQAASALNHPNILTIYELGDADGQQFIAAELIEGETLRERIKKGRLSTHEALHVAIQVVGALAASHRAGVVHRDIKPENIMLRPDGYVKVLDFGLAKLAEAPDQQPSLLHEAPIDISSWLLMGTPRYMSPEQISGQQVDARTDIYSLGVVMIEMLTGHLPVDRKDHSSSPSFEKRDVPYDLHKIVQRMLIADPDQRYGTASELLNDLRTFQSNFDLAASAATSKSRTLNLGIFGWTTAAIVLACAIGIGFTFFYYFGNDVSSFQKENEQAFGTWTTKAPISSPRWHAEPAVVDGVLYVAGGWNVCTPFADLEAYDAVNDRWTQRAPMITARGAHGVAVLNGRIYAVGGQTDCRAATASVEAYDPLSDTWTVQPPLPSERSGHVVAAVNGKLYAIGGHTSDGVPLNFNTEFDPEKKTWTEMTPMPTPRYAAAVTVVNGLIYVMGGGAQSGTQAIVEAYDPATDMWTQKRPMLKPRMSFAAAEVNETIYAFGGGGNRFQVEAYNPATDSWTVVARMPIRAFNVHAATLGGSIYIAGGSGGSDYRSTVMAFTPSNNIARESVACSKIQVAQKAEMPIIRGSMAVGEINGIVYVVGGYEKNARYLSANEAYDPATDKWKTKAPMPAARETTGTNSAVVNEKLYVIGGNASGYCSNRNEAYDPTTDSWKVMSPMPTPRCHLAVVANNGLIYAVGGTNTNGSIQYDVMEVYDPNTDKWTTAPPMPTPRMFLGAASLNGIVYVLGGANPALSDSGHLGTLEAYDPNSNTWTTKTPMPTPRDAFVAGVLNGSIMVLGGRHDETTIATVEAYDPLRDRWTTHENLATPRAFSSGLSVGDTLYVFGGKGPEEPKTPLPTEAFSLIACSD